MGQPVEKPFAELLREDMSLAAQCLFRRCEIPVIKSVNLKLLERVKNDITV